MKRCKPTGPLVGITIVTGGRNEADTFAGYLEENDMNADEWLYLDLTMILKKDPSSKVGYKQDGREPQTIRCIFGQVGFVDLINMLQDHTLGCNEWNMVFNKFLLYCRTGWHRADVTGRTFEQVLNATESERGREFNACHFGLHDAYGPTDLNDRMRRALKWSQSPWDIREGGHVQRSQLFGYEATKTDPVCQNAFHAIFDQLGERETSGMFEPAPARVTLHNKQQKRVKTSAATVEPRTQVDTIFDNDDIVDVDKSRPLSRSQSRSHRPVSPPYPPVNAKLIARSLVHPIGQKIPNVRELDDRVNPIGQRILDNREPPDHQDASQVAQDIRSLDELLHTQCSSYGFYTSTDMTPTKANKFMREKLLDSTFIDRWVEQNFRAVVIPTTYGCYTSFFGCPGQMLQVEGCKVAISKFTCLRLTCRKDVRSDGTFALCEHCGSVICGTCHRVKQGAMVESQLRHYRQLLRDILPVVINLTVEKRRHLYNRIMETVISPPSLIQHPFTRDPILIFADHMAYLRKGHFQCFKDIDVVSALRRS